MSEQKDDSIRQRSGMRCSRLLLTLILLLVGSISVLGDDALDRLREQQTADEHRKFYVHSITLRSNALLTQSEKVKKCLELSNIKIKPTDITENKLCEHIIEFNNWMSEQLKGVSEKVRGIYEKTLHDETVPWEIIKEQQDKLLSTLNDAEKKEFTELVERFTKKAEEDIVLYAHSYVNKMFSFTFGEVMPQYTMSEIPHP
ncbi:unnamed protein product [Cylicocyclus nassatus]|uniref:Uncharacterized protein n=1 Tax=Cylicocyclus nassatus TaxID=53992 RepID=A0AA36DQX9_CYLNA|nr:unnamed protein product [Cylicocyclus nassatus]